MANELDGKKSIQREKKELVFSVIPERDHSRQAWTLLVATQIQKNGWIEITQTVELTAHDNILHVHLVWRRD